MKGYGLTVFHGTRIEPFAVQVVSVMRTFRPNQAVIWVRCPEDRMQKLGPVQGMSGSPIYLWPDAPGGIEEAGHTPGQGGLLIGALALGFSGSKDCYVGVQPIEQMRRVGQRADNAAHQQDQNPPGPGARAPDPLSLQSVDQLLDQHRAQSPDSAWRARAVWRLLDRPLPAPPLAADADPAPPTGLAPPQLQGRGLELPLPIQMHSAQMAQTLAPIFERFGMAVVPTSAAGGGGVSHRASSPPVGGVIGRPPPWIDPKAIRLEPGSVLSVPLVFGDADLAAVGTVTEVRPSGQVLAFGHGMFSQGGLALPMATGYVHLIMPSIANSFKLGGSGAIQGALVRDEHSAVVGLPGGAFNTSPMRVQVHHPGTQPLEYQYQIAQHKRLTPFIAGAMAIQSITAVTGLPPRYTMRLQSQMRFTGGRSLNLKSILVNAAMSQILMELLPVAVAVMNNPHKPMMLESMDLTTHIEPEPHAATILRAQMDRSEVAPGDTARITLDIQPFGRPTVKHHIQLPIPPQLADGQYNVIVCDARNYLQLLFERRPHLLVTTGVDDLMKVIQRVLDVADDALYVMLELPDPGLALGRQELPLLPSSRRALMETATSTLATPYVEWIEQTVPLGWVARGGVHFTVTVREDPAE